MSKKLLFVDNYDSFTFNIVNCLEQLGQSVIVRANDGVSLEEINEMAPDYLVIGPGPCAPEQAGISTDVIRHFAGRIPILGICLGHQSIGEVFGGKIVRARTVMHGKVSKVHHNGMGMFRNIPSPVSCTRYHSLAVERSSLPESLTVTAWTDDGEIMGLRHRNYPIEGVQFHPEGLLTDYGHDMLHNFLEEFSDFQAA